MLNSKNLVGVMPPLPTPFDESGEVALAKLASNLEELASTGLSGFVILGSNGEYVYLDESEKVAIFKAARQAIPADRLFLAGTGVESTRATLRLTLAAAEAGADAVLVNAPFYYKPAMTKEALVKHYTTVADASPIPIILYNMPAYTGLDLSAEVILELAEHPNIIGLKESSPNVVKIGEIRLAVTRRNLDFAVLAGSASFLQAAVAVGATGGILASANVAPELCVRIFEASTALDPAATSLQHSVLPLNAAVTTRFGVAGLKYAMGQVGLYGGPVRPPLLPVTASAQAQIEQVLAQLEQATSLRVGL
jgi:4-hydroxy-2-oxoglutarate aldolase